MVRTFFVTLALAVVCSLAVSVSAVGLRERQQINAALDRKRNILRVAGLYDPAVTIDEAFRQVETRLVDLQTGDYVEDADPETFDQRMAASSAATSVVLDREQDTASLGRREKRSLVYLVKKDGKLDQVILPVRGRGLWSTLYAYIALDRDLATVRGITFYEHGETAGLGAEVENPDWQASWKGKQVFDGNGDVALHCIKGTAAAKAPHDVDGISGATLTANGVSEMVLFWFGDTGFGPYLARLKEGGSGG
jgi:Na+-transporting NADH:ubiquinone oxidoreductase subunit C